MVMVIFPDQAISLNWIRTQDMDYVNEFLKVSEMPLE